MAKYTYDVFDEKYPDYFIIKTSDDDKNGVEIPDEVIERWYKVWKACSDVDEELEKYFGIED